MARRIEIETLLDPKGIVTGATQAERAISGIKGVATDLASNLGMVAGVAATMGLVIRASMKEFISDQAALNQINAQMRVMKIGFAGASEEVQEMASRLEKLTGIADDQVMGVFGNLITYTGNYSKAMANTGLVLDLASTGMTDFGSASRIVALALEGEVASIGRLFPAFRALARELESIKDPAERSAVAMAKLHEMAGGLAAEKKLTSATSGFTNLKVALDGIAGSLGAAIVPAAAFVSQALVPLVDGLKWMVDNAGGINAAIAGVNRLAFGRGPATTSGVGMGDVQLLGNAGWTAPKGEYGPPAPAGYDPWMELTRQENARIAAEEQSFRVGIARPGFDPYGFTPSSYNDLSPMNREPIGGGGAFGLASRGKEDLGIYGEKGGGSKDAMKKVSDDWLKAQSIIEGGMATMWDAFTTKGKNAGAELAKYLQKVLVQELMGKLAGALADVLFPGSGSVVAAFGGAKQGLK
jgi:hypothetical protein